MIDLSTYLAFIVASITLAIIPGPTITVIIANSLKHGMSAGWRNVIGVQIGLALMLLVVAFGLETITTSMGFLFGWLKLVGAVYLIWLAYKMLTSDGDISVSEEDKSKSNNSFIRQGFLVVWANPKALFFFGAFIPQFVSPDENAFTQTVFLGLTFMLIGTLFDGLYATAAGKLGSFVTRRNIRATEIAGGMMLILGAGWLLFSRSK